MVENGFNDISFLALKWVSFLKITKFQSSKSLVSIYKSEVTEQVSRMDKLFNETISIESYL